MGGSGTNCSSLKMIEVNEASRSDFHEIAIHPFFSDLDHAKVMQKAYPGTKPLLIILAGSFYRHNTHLVPIPPFERVLPCRHADADYFWFSDRNQVERQGDAPPEDIPECDGARAVCLMQDVERFVIPEDFVWNIEKAMRPNHERGASGGRSRG